MPMREVTITLEQPLLVTADVNDPNSLVCYDYIPGSSLRGMFADQYLRQHGLQNGRDDPHALFEQVFLSGAVRFLNAYPVQHTLRSLPIPLPGRRRKQKELAFTLSHSGVMPDPIAIDHTVAVHVQRDPVKGRAWRERQSATVTIPHGTVFRYEALAAGQSFRALILYESAVDQAVQAAIQSGVAQLGRSRSAGYGRVRVELGAPQRAWSELPGSGHSPTHVYSMTLLSDCLLRGSTGGDCVDLNNDVLSAYLGFPVTLLPELCKVTTTIVGGFNRIWQTPLPDQHALAMGSVLVFQVADGMPLLWAQLEADGLGERRIDGYGRVAFNWILPGQPAQQGAPTQQMVEVQTHSAWHMPTWQRQHQISNPEVQLPAKESTQVTSNVTLNQHEQVLLQRSLKRRAEPQVQQAIMAFVQGQVWPQIDQHSDSWPSNSLLGRLCNSVRRAQASNNLSLVLREFQSFRQPARQAYERARLQDGTPLSTWIETVLQHPDTIWAMALRSVDSPSASYRTDTYTRQIVLRLLAAVLAAPARRRLGLAAQKEQPHA